MDFLYSDLEKTDKVLYDLLQKEKERQEEKLLLNAAISITPKSVLELQGSEFDNIDAEGYIPDYLTSQNAEELENIDKQLMLYKEYKDKRCNKCCEYANIVEALAQKRMAEVFENENAKKEDIFVNLQAPTGAIANFIVYKALLNRGDTILSLGVNDGGHTTHGDETNDSGEQYKIINYHISIEKNNIDYDEIGMLLAKHKPKLLIAGASSFPLNIDWGKIRELINRYSNNTIFMADIAHTAGLVAGKVFNNPVGLADVTTLVTYKTFGGPRAAAIITTNKKTAKKIDDTVFPKIMGSPLLLGIAGIATACKIALTDGYKKMQKKVVENSRLLCQELIKNNVNVAYGTSDTHIVLVNCKEYGTGEDIANILEDCNILVNDCHAPSKNGYDEAIRIGTTWITEENITKEGIKQIAKILSEILNKVKTNEDIDYKKYKKEVHKIKEGDLVNDNI